MPGATLTMRRSAPTEPTDTVLFWLAREFAPRATELETPLAIVAPEPRAVERVTPEPAVRPALAPVPTATLLLPATPLAREKSPKAAPPPEACAALPTATEAVAMEVKPIATV